MSGEVTETVIIGCGNLLRGDDGVGPLLIRKLWEMGLPPGVRLADGGTAGMDVAFQIGDADELIVVDACESGGEPGAIYELPGEEVETPPLQGMNLHNFRWDHALALGKWLLKDRFPKKVTVFLIEVADISPRIGLSPTVEAAMERLAGELLFRLGGETMSVDLTANGYLHLPANVAERFPTGTAIVLRRENELWLMPVSHPGAGGLLLKLRNAQGDRSVLVEQYLPDGVPVGRRDAVWDDEQGALRIPLLHENSVATP